MAAGLLITALFSVDDSSNTADADSIGKTLGLYFRLGGKNVSLGGPRDASSGEGAFYIRIAPLYDYS
jgi:hypothetical protein